MHLKFCTVTSKLKIMAGEGETTEGGALEITCTNCGSINQRSAKFCNQCGTSIMPQAAQDNGRAINIHSGVLIMRQNAQCIFYFCK